ncbi:MAG: hypothetical protein LKG17_02145 [Megasphaera sp.]|nr:hypothetical protein [Megasphaera sp.]
MIDVNMDFIVGVLIYGAAFALLYICTWRHNQFDAGKSITRKQFYYRLGYIIVIAAIYVSLLFLQSSQEQGRAIFSILQGNSSDIRHICEYALDFLILSSWAQRYNLCFKEKGWVVPILLAWCFFDLTAESLFSSAAAVKIVVFAIVSIVAIILPKDPEPEPVEEKPVPQAGTKKKNKKKGK